jgi:hypothetical protein
MCNWVLKQSKKKSEKRKENEIGFVFTLEHAILQSERIDYRKGKYNFQSFSSWFRVQASLVVYDRTGVSDLNLYDKKRYLRAA